jgi:hypothetical protein
VRTLCAAVLAFESVVVALAIPVALTTQDADPRLAGLGGGALAVSCVLVAGLLRYRWAYVAGTLLQAVVVAAGLVVPAMFLLGGIFAVLWAVALSLGARYGGSAPPAGSPGPSR